MEYLAYPFIGVIGGLLAGLLGVGGGLVIVPALSFLFAVRDMAPEHLMHIAVATSLATIVVTSISSVRAHHARGAVRWSLVRALAPGIVVGALLGGVVADFMPRAGMQLFFGVFALLVAMQMLFGGKPSAHGQLPGAVGVSAAGGVIGTISAIVGIGGGTMTVPFLVRASVPMREAVATSAACGLPIAIAGTLGFVIVGWDVQGLPAGSTGYLYWPALIGIVAASALTAPVGARLAHSLPVPLLKRFFALFVLAVGVKMLWSAM